MTLDDTLAALPPPVSYDAAVQALPGIARAPFMEQAKACAAVLRARFPEECRMLNVSPIDAQAVQRMGKNAAECRALRDKWFDVWAEFATVAATWRETRALLLDAKPQCVHLRLVPDVRSVCDAVSYLSRHGLPSAPPPAPTPSPDSRSSRHGPENRPVAESEPVSAPDPGRAPRPGLTWDGARGVYLDPASGLGFPPAAK